jgi:cytochrome oxidase Cu insertion factor (SCO1/SenC/PrrC family)
MRVAPFCARSRARFPVLGLLLSALMLQACASGGDPSQSTSSPLPSKPAPNFSLTDQFGHREQLSDFRGRVILLTFIDSHCTTICPLTSEVMTRTEQALGPTYTLQLLAVNANLEFTSVSDVRTWSAEHRMLHRWLFLTGPVSELRAVWRSYEIQVKVVHGDIAHTSGIFVIDATGAIRALFPSAARRGGVGAEALSVASAVRLVVTSGT